ncbi:MAG: type II and III secretion system protein family protein [Pseudomonadota bacterium]
MQGRELSRVLWCLVMCAGLFLATLGAVGPAAAQDSVLRTARGLASDDVNVLVNRAIVVRSSRPFVEVSVAQPEIADVSPLSDRAIYIFGRARGITTLTLLGEGGRLIANVEVRVTPDLSELKERLAEVMPEEPIEVRVAGTSIILSGVVSGKAKVARAMDLASLYVGGSVSNMMTVGGTQQVALKVRIAEMSRSVGKALGISTGAVGVTNRTSTLIETGESLDVARIDGEDDGDGLPFTQLVSGFGTFGAIFSIADSFLLGITIDAAEGRGYARTLSEPTLVALSGQSASFLAGGEVPIPVVTENGASVTFRPIGVSLDFTPVVVDEDIVNVALTTEVSSIDASVSSFISSSGGATSTVPGFATRRATTAVELRDGESFLIAGLLEETFSDNLSQLPWIGDVPVIGNLFRSVDFNRGQSELVIIVTVNLVTPVADEDAILLPTDNVAFPTEADIFLWGELEGPAQTPGPMGQELDGAFGYVVE